MNDSKSVISNTLGRTLFSSFHGVICAPRSGLARAAISASIISALAWYQI
jgi:hypothetical protein